MRSILLRPAAAGWRAPLLWKMVLFVCVCAMICAPQVQVQARRLDSRGKLKGRLTYVSTYAGVGNPNADRPLNKDITDAASTSYIVPKNTPMYHCTSVKFKQLREGPTWFSLDVVEGFKMAVKQAKVNGRDNVCLTAQPTADLKLYLMKRTEALSRADLAPLGGPRVWPNAIPAWYGKPYATNPLVQQFVNDFCTVMGREGFVGWRNPWDQDEIMLCPIFNGVGTSIASKIAYGPVVVCPIAKITPLLATNDDDVNFPRNPAAPQWPDTFKYWSDVFSDPAGGNTERLHFLMLRTVPHGVAGHVTKNVPATIDAGAALDVSAEFYRAACAVAPDYAWKLYFDVQEKRAFLNNPANAEPVPAPGKKRGDPPAELTPQQKQLKAARAKIQQELTILTNQKAYAQIQNWT